MSDDLRTVATFATPAEAAVARNALEAAGVRAAIADELTLTADPFLSGAVGYIKVQVRETDLERAGEILGERGMPVAVDYGDEADDEPDEGDDYPPVSQGERMVEFGYRAAIFGLVTCPGVLHVYSLVQVLWASTAYDLPPAANRKCWIALVIDVVMLSLFALAIAGVMRL
jgi:Putative prokaryotic signal transducing protein